MSVNRSRSRKLVYERRPSTSLQETTGTIHRHKIENASRNLPSTCKSTYMQSADWSNIFHWWRNCQNATNSPNRKGGSLRWDWHARIMPLIISCLQPFSFHIPRLRLVHTQWGRSSPHTTQSISSSGYAIAVTSLIRWPLPKHAAILHWTPSR